ncbi:MAG: hypothetical protein ACLR5G_04475 [Eubacteriales bacterium]
MNWKSTAAHGRLLVNVEEKVQKLQANIIINMCSHMIEPDLKFRARRSSSSTT